MLQPRVLLGVDRFVHGGEVAGMMGIFNGVLGTCQENRRWDGTPHDVLARYDMARISRQVDQIGVLLCGVEGTPGLLNAGDLSLPNSIPRGGSRCFPSTFQSGRVSGPTVMSVPPGSAVPNEPVPGAIVQVLFRRNNRITQRHQEVRSFDDFYVLMTDGNGSHSLVLSYIWRLLQNPSRRKPSGVALRGGL